MTIKLANIPLNEREIAALTELVRNGIVDTGSNRKAAVYRAILNKLEHASVEVLRHAE